MCDVTTVEYELRDRIALVPKPVLGQRIRESRGEKGKPGYLSHDRLAARVGTTRQHLIRLEHGKHRPGEEMLSRIADATSREVEWFLRPDPAQLAPFRG